MRYDRSSTEFDDLAYRIASITNSLAFRLSLTAP